MEIKVLVVDSSAKVRKNITRSLQEIGVRDVVEAAHTNQAEELLQNGVFDIVIAAWNGQAGSENDPVKSVRQFDANVPVIVTAPQSKKLSNVAENCPGATSYLMVPFTTEELRKAVCEYAPSIAG